MLQLPAILRTAVFICSTWFASPLLLAGLVTWEAIVSSLLLLVVFGVTPAPP